MQKSAIKPENPMKFKGNEHVGGVPGTGRTGKGATAAWKALQRLHGGKKQ